MSLPPKPRRAISSAARIVTPGQLPQAVGELIDIAEKTEDWKGRISQRVANLEARVEFLHTVDRESERAHATDRVWLEQQFAEIRQSVALTQASVKQIMATALVVWTVVSAVIALVWGILRG